jgi:phage-related protein
MSPDLRTVGLLLVDVEMAAPSLDVVADQNNPAFLVSVTTHVTPRRQDRFYRGLIQPIHLFSRAPGSPGAPWSANPSWQWKASSAISSGLNDLVHILRYNALSAVHRWRTNPQAKKIALIFFRTLTGSEPVREWLKELPEEERQAIGKDLLRAQWRWPVGMPLCRAMGSGLWEIRTDLPTKRTARVLLCVYREHLVALHGFIKKTRATPDEDLALARKRKKELEQ